MYNQDWFKFQAEAGVHYTIETLLGLGVPVTADTYLVLSNGQSNVAVDDNSGIFKLSRIEWECKVSGTYYIGVMGNQSSPSYTGNYQLSLTSKKMIYLGVLGGDAYDLIGSYPSVQISNITPGQTYKNYNASNDNDVDLLGTSGNGVEAVGLKLSGLTASGLFRISPPGAVLYNANYIDNKFSNNDEIIMAGHSAGGGDIQDIARRLNDLGRPIILTAQIDSIERSICPEPDGNPLNPIDWFDCSPANEFDQDDKNIPANVKYAVNYFETETDIAYFWDLNGENSISADNTNTTIVGNFQVINPIGPAIPLDQGVNPHKNIDNDPRVWKNGQQGSYDGILGYINQYSFLNNL